MNLMTIIIALIVFGVIVTVHEMGHFFTAKYFGVTVHEFSVGMGPKLYSKTKRNRILLKSTSAWRICKNGRRR